MIKAGCLSSAVVLELARGGDVGVVVSNFVRRELDLLEGAVILFVLVLEVGQVR